MGNFCCSPIDPMVTSRSRCHNVELSSAGTQPFSGAVEHTSSKDTNRPKQTTATTSTTKTTTTISLSTSTTSTTSTSTTTTTTTKKKTKIALHFWTEDSLPGIHAIHGMKSLAPEFARQWSGIQIGNLRRSERRLHLSVFLLSCTWQVSVSPKWKRWKAFQVLIFWGLSEFIVYSFREVDCFLTGRS